MRLNDAEDLWLACVCQTPAYADHSLVTDDHLSPRGKKILEQIRDVHKQGWPAVAPEQLEDVDLRTIPRRLDIIDAPSTLPTAEQELLNAWANSQYYHALLRAAETCTQKGREAAETELMETVQTLIGSASGLHWKRPDELAREIVARRYAELTAEVPVRTLGSGLPAIDRACGFWQPARQTTIGGWTGQGKSTLTLELLSGLAFGGARTAFISLEDESVISTKRQLAMVLEHIEAIQRLQSNESTMEDLDLIRAAIEKDISRLDMDMTHMPGATADRVCHAIHDAARRGARVIGVDYLQCFDVPPHEKRSLGLGRAARQLKAAASQVGVHLMLVSQLRRPQEGHKTRPTMYMFKETGDVENISEYALLVWRPQKDSKSKDMETAHIIIDKAKDGGVGMIDVGWDRFRNVFSAEPPAEAATGQREIGAGGYTYED